MRKKFEEKKGEYSVSFENAVFLSGKMQKLWHLKQLNETVERVKNLFPDIAEPLEPILVLSKIIEAVQIPGYLENHVHEMREIIPLCMNIDAQGLSKPTGAMNDYFEMIQVTQKNDACERREHIMMQYILRSLLRSEQNIELPVQISREGFCKDIGLRANRYYNRLKIEYGHITESTSSDTPTCRGAIMKTVLSDYRVYPILPALLTLDAVNQVFCNTKSSKSDLVQSVHKLPSLDETVGICNSTYKIELHFIRDIQRVLSEELDIIYKPISVGIEQSQQSVFGRYQNEVMEKYMEHVDTENENNAVKEQEKQKPKWKRCKQFGILFCKTDKLAVDLALFCGLPYEKMLQLRRDLPWQIICSELNEDEIKNKYGEQAAEIIKVFSLLSNAKSYSKGGKWNEFLFDTVEHYSKSTKQFFRVRDRNNLKIAYNVMRKYFYNINFSKRVLMRASSTLPLLGNKGAFPKYYSELIDNFAINSEERLYQASALNLHLGISTKSLSTKEYPLVPGSIKHQIKEALTTKDAIDMIREYRQIKKPTNIKTLKKNVSDRLSKLKISTDESVNYYLGQGDGSVLSLYQFLLKESCDIIGHYSAIILLRCNALWWEQYEQVLT